MLNEVRGVSNVGWVHRVSYHVFFFTKNIVVKYIYDFVEIIISEYSVVGQYNIKM